MHAHACTPIAKYTYIYGRRGVRYADLELIVSNRVYWIHAHMHACAHARAALRLIAPTVPFATSENLMTHYAPQSTCLFVCECECVSFSPCYRHAHVDEVWLRRSVHVEL